MVRALPFVLVACATPRHVELPPREVPIATTHENAAQRADERPARDRHPEDPLATAHDAPAIDAQPVPSATPDHGPTPEPPRSGRLPNGLFNPMPGGVFAGYRADTGLDLAGIRRPVFAIAAGTLDYSEPGHTRWTGPGDTDGAVRLALDEPIPHEGRLITHVWYAHLSELRFRQAEGAVERIRVEGGELLGVSGVANGSPHLHLGLLLDGEVEQRWGSYLLEDEVREVLGGHRTGERLPP